MIRVLNRWVCAFGFDIRKCINAFRGLPSYLMSLMLFRKFKDKTWPLSLSYPCLDDRFQQAGIAGGHYFWQDLHVASKIYQSGAVVHHDIGSRIDGFIAHISIFTQVVVYDVRPLLSSIPNVNFVQMDLTEALNADFKRVKSLSCLHALEHFGLGRYGDPVGSSLWKVALSNIYSMLDVDGILYFSVPIGTQRIEFNAHRVFDPMTVIDYLNTLELIDFSYVDDAGIINNIGVDMIKIISLSTNLKYGCGIFTFKKLS